MNEEKTLDEMKKEAQEETTQKEASMDTTQQTNKDDSNAENALRAIAGIILALGIIATIICAFTITYTNEGVYFVEKKANIDGIITTITILFTSVVSWALMRVIADISTTLKEINKKIK